MNDNKSEIRVRFAPSPTGFLHVGGARTAIFNWLFARHTGGKFLLRIEDTDPERSKGELTEQILRSMNWLGMDADEPIVYQALNAERHREISYALLESGKAYRAFETAEELEEQRKQSQANKIPFKYNRASLRLDSGTIEKYLAEGRPYAIRFKVPEGVTEFEDIVHGKTVFNNNEIDDFVILRSDGSPVYMIAVVVDDNDMGITHVIRGDDHLSNTPKQIMLYNAMGWNVPQFAHLPMILDETKKKLSKRRNPVSVEEYKLKGYLPEAMFNFLTLLGFAPRPSPPAPLPKGEGSNETVILQDNKSIDGSPPAPLPPAGRSPKGEGSNETVILQDNKSIDGSPPAPLPPAGRSPKGEGSNISFGKQEIVSREDLVKMFTFERVNKKSAVFDMKKLGWINSEYIRTADENRLADLLIENNPGICKDAEPDRLYIISVIKLMKERVNTIQDFIDFGKYFFTEPETYDSKGLEKHWTSEIKEKFSAYIEQLENLSDWSPALLEENLRLFADVNSLKAAQLIHPLRLALTGISVSPGIFEVMELLGKEKVISRMRKLLEYRIQGF